MLYPISYRKVVGLGVIFFFFFVKSLQDKMSCQKAQFDSDW